MNTSFLRCHFHANDYLTFFIFVAKLTVVDVGADVDMLMKESAIKINLDTTVFACANKKMDFCNSSLCTKLAVSNRTGQDSSLFNR